MSENLHKDVLVDETPAFDPAKFIEGQLTLEGSEHVWSIRPLYDLNRDKDFRFSFDFYLETGDADIRIAFSHSKIPYDQDGSDALQFRISGEADMTGTYLKSQMQQDDEWVYYKDATEITFGRWYHVEFILTRESLDILFDGENLHGTFKLYAFPLKGYVGFVRSAERPDRVRVRNVAGDYSMRDLIEE